MNGVIDVHLPRDSADACDTSQKGPKLDGTTRDYYRWLKRNVVGRCSHCGEKFGDGIACETCGSMQTRIP